ncbi:MAG TPA: hypothetical protein DFH96_03870 [Bacteroidetes bacterium]|jgi:hypothetical protein|nr:hypothetical protein [Bacteroidota bacterium]HRC81896.1 hypothetical protein [Sedimentibacter sp.]
MEKIRLYWLNGKTEVIEGNTAAEAFTKAGYGAGALKALDFYDLGETQSYEYNKAKGWVKKQNS